VRLIARAAASPGIKFFETTQMQQQHKEWQTMARKLVVGFAVLALITAFTVPAFAQG